MSLCAQCVRPWLLLRQQQGLCRGSRAVGWRMGRMGHQKETVCQSFRAVSFFFRIPQAKSQLVKSQKHLLQSPQINRRPYCRGCELAIRCPGLTCIMIRKRSMRTGQTWPVDLEELLGPPGPSQGGPLLPRPLLCWRHGHRRTTLNRGAEYWIERWISYSCWHPSTHAPGDAGLDQVGLELLEGEGH